MVSDSSEATDAEVRRAIEEMELREYGEVQGLDRSNSPSDELPDTSREATDAEVREAVENSESEEEADSSMFSFSDV